MDLKHGVGTELASTSLVSLGGVGVAIDEDELTGIQGGFDEFADQLSAGGEHQREFRPGSHVERAGVQNDAADLLANVRGTRLASGDDFEPFRTQNLGQTVELRA